MAGPDFAAEAANLRDQYALVEQMLLVRVSARLAKGIDQVGWTEAKLAETAAMRLEVQRTLAQASGLQVQMQHLITSAFTKGAQDAAIQVGKPGVIVAQLTRTNVEAIRVLTAATARDFSQASGAILRNSMDVYRKVIAESTQQVVAGQATRLQATQTALDRFASQGITGFIDKAGRNWTMESYAEMATRTATTNAFKDAKMQTFQDAEIHEFLVSQTGNPCDACDPWEGEVVQDDESEMDYPTISEMEDTGWGHPNCGHTLDAFTPGTEDILQEAGAMNAED